MTFDEIFLWAMSLFIPFILFIIGAIFQKYPPKTISRSFGYRTRRSLRSQETWNAAQELFGKYLFLLGLALLIAVPATLYCFSSAFDPYILLLIYIIAESLLIALPVLAVERYLKLHFPEQ